MLGTANKNIPFSSFRNFDWGNVQVWALRGNKNPFVCRFPDREQMIKQKKKSSVHKANNFYDFVRRSGICCHCRPRSRNLICDSLRRCSPLRMKYGKGAATRLDGALRSSLHHSRGDGERRCEHANAPPTESSAEEMSDETNRKRNA